MRTRLLCTRQRLLLAMFARPSFRACAVVLLAKGIVGARATIQARFVLATAHFDFAFAARVTGRTLACERTVAGVEACATVLAWPMVGAIVQILIAKQTAPTFVATAFPWLLACAVNASRIWFAHVAQSTFPAGLASALEENKRERERKKREIN